MTVEAALGVVDQGPLDPEAGVIVAIAEDLRADYARREADDLSLVALRRGHPLRAELRRVLRGAVARVLVVMFEHSGQQVVALADAPGPGRFEAHTAVLRACTQATVEG